MANNVAASMTASIVIDKKELISNALAAYASAQKELDGNKIELLIDVSSDEARNKLKEIQKELSGKEYIIKFKNQGIEETIKSLDELANKIKDIISGKSTGNGKGNSFINEENLKVALDLFAKMESHLDSMRKVFADVGDGEEFSPLLKMINDVQKAVSNLGETVGKIKLNVNIESKGTDEQLLAKIEQRKQVLLNAYRDQFNAMRKVKPSGADVINSFGLASKSGSTVAALNKSISMFDESSLDSLDQKISAYEDMIKKLKRLSELSYGTNIYDGMDKSFQNKVSAAKGSLTKAINSLDSNSPDGLEGLFGKTDLSGIITQLETIADKLDKISKSASEFATSFKEGFNVNASIEELNKLTDRVKELEEELAKLKVSPVVSDRTPATSSPMKDAFQGDDKATTDASTTAIKEESQALEQVATSAKDAATSKEKFANANKEVKASAESSSTSLDEEKKKIENVGYSAEETKKKLDDVVFKPNTEGFDEIVSKLDIAKDKIEEISKITKSSVWSESQGEYLESYNIKYKNGTSEIRGESSNKKGSNVLRANEVAYDAKVAEQEAKALLEVERQLTKETEQQASAQQKKWKSFQQEQANYEKIANEVNNAISKTDELLNKLQLHEKLDSQFLGLLDSVDELNSKLKAGEISVSDYNKSVKSLTSEYSKLVTIQQKKDVETYEANAKAAEQEAKALADAEKAKQKAIDNSKLEESKRIYKELNDSLDRYYTVSKRIESNNALGSDYEEAARLQEKIEELQNHPLLSEEQLQASQNKLEKIETTLEDIQKITKETTLDSIQSDIDGYYKSYNSLNLKPDKNNRSAEYQQKLDNYIASIKELEVEKERLSKLDSISEEELSRYKELKEAVQENINALKSMSSAQKGSDALSRGKEIDTITKYLNKFTGISKEAKQELNALLYQLQSGDPSANVKKIHERFLELTVAERNAGREARNLFDIFKDKKIYSLIGQAASMFSFYDIINVARQAGEAVIDLNTNITELAKVSEASTSQIYDDFNSYADIAKEVGGTISDTISATADWSRNGYNVPDSKELAEVAMIYKNVGDGIDIDQANEYLISTLRGFSLEAKDAMDIIDSINEVANNEPISSAGIGEALQRSAAAFNVANTSLQESIALVTSTNSVLQSPEKVGSMWTTVSARIRGAKTELEDAGLETDGMVESTSKLQSLIKGMTGFDILEDDQKTFKSIYDIIIGIGEEFQNLSGVDQAALLEALAGKRQSNALAATLNNIDLLKKAYGEATNAQGSAMAEQEKYQQSIQYSIDRTKASLEELANDFISSDFLKGLIDSGDKLINILDLLIDKFGVLGTTAIVGGGILGGKNIGREKCYPSYRICL